MLKMQPSQNVLRKALQVLHFLLSRVSLGIPYSCSLCMPSDHISQLT
jgi:hypothetical protein